MKTPTEIVTKIVSDYANGVFKDRDQKRFAFYERTNLESESFERWLTGENPFYSFERYSDEPIVYMDDDTQTEWESWLAKKGISLSDEYQ